MAASGDRSNGRRQKRSTSKTSSAMTRIDRNSANLCLRDQAKHLEKLLFAATNDLAIDGIEHRLLSCYHSQRLLLSHSKNNFSTTPTLTEEPRYTYCRVFFVHSIYSTTIDIITNNILFSIFKQCLNVYMCISGPPADGINLHATFYPGDRLTARFCM